MNLLSVAITAETILRTKTRFGYSERVLFGVKRVYSDFGGWSRLTEQNVFAFTSKGLDRKIARRTATLQQRLIPTA